MKQSAEDIKHINDCISQMEERQRNIPYKPTKVLSLADFEASRLQIESSAEMVSVKEPLPSNVSQRRPRSREVPLFGGAYLAKRQQDRLRVKRILTAVLFGALVVTAIIVVFVR